MGAADGAELTGEETPGLTERLTDGELSWMKLLVKSTTQIRETLLAGQTPTHNDLIHLVNRADALLWHLAKRDTLPDAVRAVVEQHTPTERILDDPAFRLD